MDLSFGPSNFSLRHDIYRRFQRTIEHRHVSVYICMERNNSQDLFADQYIPIVLLEMTSWLPVYSSSMINIAAIDRKNFEQLHDNVASKQHFPDQQKSKVDNSKI